MTKSANDNMTSLHLIRNEASNWGNWVVAYLCIQTVWTMDITVAWKTSCKCKHVATRVGSFALHIIFCLGLIGGGVNWPLSPQMTPLVSSHACIMRCRVYLRLYVRPLPPSFTIQMTEDQPFDDTCKTLKSLNLKFYTVLFWTGVTWNLWDKKDYYTVSHKRANPKTNNYNSIKTCQFCVKFQT